MPLLRQVTFLTRATMLIAMTLFIPTNMYTQSAATSHSILQPMVAGRQPAPISRLDTHTDTPARLPNRVMIASDQIVNSVVISQTLAYLGTDSGLTILDVSSVSHPMRIASIPISSIYALTILGSLVYLATNVGVQIIDMHTPGAPILLGTFDGIQVVRAIQIVGDRAYVTASGGLFILDVQDPGNPQLLGHYTTLFPAYHVDVQGHLAYLAGDGFQILDVSDPQHIQLIGSYQIDAKRIQVVGQKAYVLYCCRGRDDAFRALKLLDVSTPSSPIDMGDYFPYSSENILFAGLGQTFKVAGSHLYAPEIGTISGSNPTQIVDITDFSAPQLLSRYQAGRLVSDIAISSGVAYIAASEAGLEIVDIHDSTHPVLLSAYPWRGALLPVLRR